MDDKLISFIVVNYNGGAMLTECLESIQAQTISNYEVIVIDNGSTDGSCDLDLFQLDDWRLLKFDRNLGFAQANNEAFRVSSGTFIALVNNDIVLAPEWAETMSKVFDDPEQRVGSAACRILQKSNPQLLDSAGFQFFSCGTTSSWYECLKDTFTGKDHHPFGAVASAAMYRRSAIEETGLFHNEYFCYYEDTDLAVRLVLHGFDTVYSNDSTAYHHGSFTGEKRSDFHIFHLRRNIEYLYWIDMAGPLAWRYFLPHFIYECLAFFGAVVTGQALVVLKAKLDFLRHLPWIRTQRRELASKLHKSDRLKTARDMLQNRTSNWIPALIRKENIHKFRQPTDPLQWHDP